MAGRPKTQSGVAHAGSGIQEDGQWVPAFERQRPPFAADNRLAVKHAAYSRLAISERSTEIADDLRSDFQRAADELALQALAECWAQVQLAGDALAAVRELMKTPGQVAAARLRFIQLSADERAWLNSFFKILDRLAATPAARAEVAARLAKVQASPGRIDLTKLSPQERIELEALVERAQA